MSGADYLLLLCVRQEDESPSSEAQKSVFQGEREREMGGKTFGLAQGRRRISTSVWKKRSAKRV